MIHGAITGNVPPVEQVLGFYDGSGMKFTVVIVLPLLAERALETGDISTAAEMNGRALDLLATGEAEPCMSAEAYRIAARIEAARGDEAAGQEWPERAWAATQATGSHFFAFLTATDALGAGFPADPWQQRLNGTLRHVSSQLPEVLIERAERQ